MNKEKQDLWQEYNFFDVIEVLDFRGRTPKKLNLDWGGDIPALSANNVKMGKIDYSVTTNFGNEELYSKWMTKGDLEIGDLVLTTEAPAGNVVVISENKKYILSQRVIGLKPDKKVIDSNYLMYFFMSNYFRHYLQGYGTGTTVTGISQKNLEFLRIIAPPLKEQQKIAEILSSVDAAIEKTEQVIAKTEEVKKGLMQQLLTKGIGHTEFKQTEIGEIPVEWKFLPLNKLGEFKNGINKSKEDFGFGSYFVNISDIYANEIIEEHLLGRLNATDKERAVYKLNKGDIVVVRSSVKPEGVGYPILYRGSKEDVLYCGFTIRYRYDQEILFDKYLLHVLRSPRVRMDVLKYASVSANTNINQDSYGKIKIPIPPFEEQIKIAQVIDEVNAKITLEKTKVTRFGVIKQGLMQQLLTGQVRVKVD